MRYEVRPMGAKTAYGVFAQGVCIFTALSARSCSRWLRNQWREKKWPQGRVYGVWKCQMGETPGDRPLRR